MVYFKTHFMILASATTKTRATEPLT